MMLEWLSNRRSSLTGASDPRNECPSHAVALDVLNRYWGYGGFRDGQLRIIEHLVQGRDGLAILPTGGGKSLCYQVPALLRGGTTLVVSPLISLMEDQVAALTARGISAWSLSGSTSRAEMEGIIAAARRCPAALIYLSPERLMSKGIRSLISSLDVRLMAIDEAHCISEWGHDFRPSYRSIPEVYKAVRRPPVLAVTATATPRVRSDISRSLHLINPDLFLGDIDRPRIVFSVFYTPAKGRKLNQILAHISGSAIVYAPTRRAVEWWAAFLNRSGTRAGMYHAGLNSEERASVQHDWQKNIVRAIVATNAFGMGIDKPDVRSVTHVGLPLSLEGYFQEAGRAGRDGATAYSTLLFDQADIKRYRTYPVTTRRASTKMRQVLAYACSQTCRRRTLLGHFGTYRFRDCGTCDCCLKRQRPYVPSPDHEEVARKILFGVEHGRSIPEISRDLGVPEYRIRHLIDWLNRHDYLHLSEFPEGGVSLTRLGRSMIARAA